MGEADFAGVTRNGTRWELTFEGTDQFRVTETHLLDVMKMLKAHIEILGEEPAERHEEEKRGPV